MSFINYANFKASSDIDIPIQPREPENFTTAAVNHSTVLEFARVCKQARIINNDAVNQLTFRLHSNTGVVRIVPPSSELTINEWFSDIFITPDGVTGDGQLEMDLVRIEDARRDTRR